MLLAIDLGNTNTTFGLFSGQSLLHIFRAETRHERTADEYAVLIRQLLSLRSVQPVEVEHAIIASVVPALTDVWVAALRLAFDGVRIVFLRHAFEKAFKNHNYNRIRLLIARNRRSGHACATRLAPL